jgi:phage protein D
VSLDGPTYKVLAQVNQSDLAFMRARARAVNAEVWVEDTKLLAKKRTDRSTDAALDLAYGINLVAVRARADLAHQCTEVGVAGWDVAAKEAIEETGDESAIGNELNGGVSGASVLQKAFGARKERVVHTVPLTSEEARAIAQARYRERARRFVTVAATSDGDARIRVGSVLNLGSLGPLFNGKYIAVSVRHSYDGIYGFRTEFEAERAGLGQP